MASLLEALPNDVQQNIIERVLPPGDRLDEGGLKSLHSLRATSKYMRARIDGDDAYFEKLCKAIWCMKWQPYACDFRFLHGDYLAMRCELRSGMTTADVPVEDWGLIPRGVFREERIPWRRAFLGACRLFHRNIPKDAPSSWDPYITMGYITDTTPLDSQLETEHGRDVVLQNLMGQIRTLGWDWEAQIQVTLGTLLSTRHSDDRFPIVDFDKYGVPQPIAQDFELLARQASILSAELCGAAYRDAARVTLGQILSGIIPKNRWLTTVGTARVRERLGFLLPGTRNAMAEVASLCSLTGASKSIEETLPRIKELMKVGIPAHYPRWGVPNSNSSVEAYNLFAYGVLQGSVELLDLIQQVYRPKREALLPQPDGGLLARFHEIFGGPESVRSYLDVPLWTWDDDLFDYLIDLIPERCKERYRIAPGHRYVEFLHHSFQLAIVKGRHRPIRRLISMGVFQANFIEARTRELRLRMGGGRSNLNMAVSEGNVELVTFLLKHKQPDKDILFSIGMAVAQNRVEILTALLREYGQRLDHCEQMLVDALAHRNEEMLRILIKYGASVDPSRNVPAHRIPGWPGGQSLVEFARVCMGDWAADAVGGCHLRRAPPSPEHTLTDGTEEHWEKRHANDDENLESYDCDEQSDVEDYGAWSGEDDGGGNDEHNPDSYPY